VIWRQEEPENASQQEAQEEDPAHDEIAAATYFVCFITPI
jgi:hypothetical protein